MSNYSKFKYFVEKQITYNDSPNVHFTTKNDLFLYIIREFKHNSGFFYVTHKKLAKDTQILGEQLQFIDVDFNEPIFIKKTKSKQDIEYLQVKQEKDTKLIPKTYKIKFIPRLIFYNYEYDEVPEELKNKPFKNKFKIHTSKIVIDKKDWFLDYFKNTENLTKNILKELLRGAIIDDKIKKVLKTEFFNFASSDLAYKMPHIIILSQGGTGKSSIIGLLGYNLDNSSDAGIFGYFDTKRSSWNSGVVEKTDKAIIIDETNELINKKLKVLDTLNKPLEQGVFQGGKAGSREVRFGNQFIFLGNISNEFNFSNFIVGLSNNTLTIGRRFGYFIYDLNLKFKNGKQRIKSLNTKIEVFIKLISFKFYKYYKKHKLEYVFSSNKIQKRVNEFNKWFNSKIKKEIEIEIIIKFFEEFQKALSSRVVLMALEITYFDLFNDMIKKEVPKHIFMQRFFKEYDLLIRDIKEQITNIVKHINNTEITETINKVKDNYESLDKYTQNLIDLIILNKDKFNDNKKLIYPNSFEKYNDKIQKDRLKYLIKNLKNQTKSLNKLNLDLNLFGLKCVRYNDKFYFVIINKIQFDNVVENLIDNKKKTIKMNNVEVEAIDILEELENE